MFRGMQVKATISAAIWRVCTAAAALNVGCIFHEFKNSWSRLAKGQSLQPRRKNSTPFGYDGKESFARLGADVPLLANNSALYSGASRHFKKCRFVKLYMNFEKRKKNRPPKTGNSFSLCS